MIPLRAPRPRRFLMCRPDHFDVTYSINPWMSTEAGVDRDLAIEQWETLRATYEAHGHTVDLLDPVPGLPDMVFAANGSFVRAGRALVARFAHPERTDEAAAHTAWLKSAGIGGGRQAAWVNEGEGDLVAVGDLVLAGTGFRTAAGAHTEVAAYFDAPVVTLQLVDPRYYHLDTALFALDDANIAYHPDAFSPSSRRRLERMFPDAVLVGGDEAAVLGLNAVSDGLHVFVTDQAPGLHVQLKERGYVPVPLDLSELLKAGGGIKCCTLEVRS
ncbi:UNVERIFIED_CONTAM: hypothetical protein LK11_45635 [Mumia flava]